MKPVGYMFSVIGLFTLMFHQDCFALVPGLANRVTPTPTGQNFRSTTPLESWARTGHMAPFPGKLLSAETTEFSSMTKLFPTELPAMKALFPTESPSMIKLFPTETSPSVHFSEAIRPHNIPVTPMTAESRPLLTASPMAPPLSREMPSSPIIPVHNPSMVEASPLPRAVEKPIPVLPETPVITPQQYEQNIREAKQRSTPRPKRTKTPLDTLCKIGVAPVRLFCLSGQFMVWSGKTVFNTGKGILNLAGVGDSSAAKSFPGMAPSAGVVKSAPLPIPAVPVIKTPEQPIKIIEEIPLPKWTVTDNNPSPLSR